MEIGPKIRERRRPTPTGQSTMCAAPRASPSGRFHPDKARRADLRAADLTSDVSFFASSVARLANTACDVKGGFAPSLASGPSGDVTLPSAMPTSTQSWIANQAWLESLRYHQDDKMGSFSGLTHGPEHQPSMEAGVRIRAGVHAPDPAWDPEQLQVSLRKATGSKTSHVDEHIARRLDEALQKVLETRKPVPEAAATQRIPLSRRRAVKPSRLVSLAAPKVRLSQDRHLHAWELEARKQQIYVAHQPVVGLLRRASTDKEQSTGRSRPSSKAGSRRASNNNLIEVKL